MQSQNTLRADFSPPLRWLIGVVSVAGLLLVFLFQRFDWASWLGITGTSEITRFLINRSFRFLLNDIFGIALVLALFGKRSYAVIAVYTQLLGVLLILLPYVILKINYPHYNGPMISFLHRLVLNPLLIYLLIFFFWFQEKNRRSAGV